MSCSKTVVLYLPGIIMYNVSCWI